MYQALLDDMPAAMAVFSAEGRLSLVNAAYAALWGVEPGAVIGVLSVTEATRTWQARARPSGIWGDIRKFALPQSDRAGWSDAIVLGDGRAFRVDVVPLSGGAMAVSFHCRKTAAEGQTPDAPITIQASPPPFAPPPMPVQQQFAEAARPYRPATDGKE